QNIGNLRGRRTNSATPGRHLGWGAELRTIVMGRLPVDSTLRKLRQKVRQLYREHIALCVFFHEVSSTEKPYIEQTIELIDNAKKRDLREFCTKLKASKERIARYYGLRVPVADIIKLTDEAVAAEVGRQMLLSKGLIRTVCSRYQRSFPEFDRLPEHAFIG